MPDIIKNVLHEFAKDMRSVFGSNLSEILVYGSYARGDYSENSDVDVMILVKMADEEIRRYMDQVADCAFEYLMRCGIDISPVIKNEEHFYAWADALPYYRNVREEGLFVNAG